MDTSLKTRFAAAFLCLAMLFTTACAANETSSSATLAEVSVSEESLVSSSESSSESVVEETIEPETDTEEYPPNGDEPIVTETMKMYVYDQSVTEIPFSYYESTPEILLIDTELACSVFLNQFLSTIASYTYEETDTTLTITKHNGATCVLDFVEDTITFENFDLFNTHYSDATADLLSSQYLGADGNPIYLKRTGSTDIAGMSICIDLASRNIPLDIYEGKKYIPFQTFCDLFYAHIGTSFLYNSKDVFMVTTGQIAPSIQDEYYSIEQTERSEALINYNLNELCLLLDLYYGLQDEHGVKVGFDVYLDYAGLTEDLLSSDATKAALALASLTRGYLADNHSGMSMASPYTGSSELDQTNVQVHPSIVQFIEYIGDIQNAKKEAMPDGDPGYQEIDNTAYISFDSFTIDPSRYADYSAAPTEIVDVIGLIIHAHSMTNRENSPIENVVLDLSCNTGGAFDSAVYVVSWMLGYCDLSITNPVTNSYSTVSYQADVNLDGVFDENDTITDKNLYCIISPASFSCGNLVPSLLKASGRVTMLGGTSGGGACSIQHASTADGCTFAFSSPYRLSVVSNGSYYTVDRGVDPHYYLSKFESYFDREALTAYINDLK